MPPPGGQSVTYPLGIRCYLSLRNDTTALRVARPPPRPARPLRPYGAVRLTSTARTRQAAIRSRSEWDALKPCDELHHRVEGVRSPRAAISMSDPEPFDGIDALLLRLVAKERPTSCEIR